MTSTTETTVRGLALFPCYEVNADRTCACGNPDCNDIGKHPRTLHGLYDATNDPEGIQRYWTQYPNANFGINCQQSGIVVIDSDAKPEKGIDGIKALRDLEERLGPLPETVTALTGGGGQHLYFVAPEGEPLPSSVGQLAPGVDIRARGGYVIAPPSTHKSGRQYQWKVGHGPDDISYAELPEAWITAIRGAASTNGHSHERLNVADILNGVDEGQRDEMLFKLASKLRGADVPEDAADELLLKAAANCRPPFPEQEALTKVRSAYSRYAPNVAEDDESEPVTFPLDALPETVRTFVVEGAAALGAPVDYIAVPLLAFAGVAMGNRYALGLKKGFSVLPTLFVCAVGPPSSVKTPALLLARSPLDALQGAANDRYQQRVEQYENDLAVWQATPKATRGREPRPPTEEHFLTTDATMEAIGSMLSTSAGLALIRDEYAAWVRSFDAYRSGRGGDRENWLSIWSTSPLKIDRKGKPSIQIPRPVVSVVGGIQPDMLPSLSNEAGRRDGFIERILFSYPTTTPAQWTEDEVSDQTLEAVNTIFKRLAQPGPVSQGSLVINTQGPAASIVDLSQEAKKRWSAWYNLKQRLAAEAKGTIAGAIGKLPIQVGRLALILHALEAPDKVSAQHVSDETLEYAISLGDYFLAHARRVYPHFRRKDDREASLDTRVLALLEDAAPQWLAKQDIFRALGYHVTAVALDAALRGLRTLGVAEQRTVKTTGRPREEWRAVGKEPVSDEHT